MRYSIIVILVTGFLFTSCSSSKSTIKSKKNEQTKIEIIKRLERPGDGAYFASSELELKPDIDLPIWDIPELVPIEDYDDNSEFATSVFIIKRAKTFEGTPYKFGGTTNKGMDCSGLVYTAFKSQDIYMPRISSDMANEGKRINIKNAQPGDLLFFKTNRRRNVINHVGIVVESSGNDVQFIHSSTSKGVIISSINEAYWKNAFTEARRVL